MNKINENYLKLVEDTILSNIHKYNYSPLTYTKKNPIKNLIKFLLNTLFNNNLKEITIKSKIKDKDIEDGLIRGTNSFSMIGLKRLKNIRYLIEKINEEKISGDLIEAGIWKGGVIIYMRACLLSLNMNNKVFGADSFAGLPEIDDQTYPEDKIYRKILKNGNDKGLIISEDEVIENLNKFGFHDDNTILLKGWFHETLKDERINKISLLRIDGDMYKSTYEALNLLYHKVTKGGYVVIDDYGLKSQACKKAVDDFRKEKDINSELINIDWSGIYWKK